MWTIWQNRDLKERQYALKGTVLNYDPSTAPLLTLDTVVDWGVLGPAKRFKEVMSNLKGDLKGDFNYVYENMEG